MKRYWKIYHLVENVSHVYMLGGLGRHTIGSQERIVKDMELQEFDDKDDAIEFIKFNRDQFIEGQEYTVLPIFRLI